MGSEVEAKAQEGMKKCLSRQLYSCSTKRKS